MVLLPRKRAEASRDGDKRRHFAQGQHSDKDDGADDGVADQHRRWPAGGQRLARAQEQAGANGAANGNHLHLAGREGALETVLLDMALGNGGTLVLEALNVGVGAIFGRVLFERRVASVGGLHRCVAPV